MGIKDRYIYVGQNFQQTEKILSVEDLVATVGIGEHHLIPRECQSARIDIVPNEMVKIYLTCLIDRETMQQVAPELLAQIDSLSHAS